MAIKRNPNNESPAMRWAVVAAIAAVAFFGSYRYAVAQSPQAQAASAAGVTTAAGATSLGAGGGGCCGGGASTASAAGGAASGSAAGGCCGSGAVKGPKTTKTATVAGATQKISVDLSKGYYDPSTIQLKAGVPAEITFGQGSGCLGQVQSQQLGFAEDLTSGPKTVKIAGLPAGTYQYTCGMGMVSGSIVVK